MGGQHSVKPLERNLITERFRDAKVPLFAVVIGIDNYQNHRKLSGAVADANAVDAYLRCYLGVPESRIRNLRDGQATRNAIIEAFLALGHDPDIGRGDAILIYYAGYGGVQKAPLGWETRGKKIQVVIPQDADLTASASQPIPSIPDRTISALLDNLADKKGDNIARTVVFDCCYSALGTRDDQNVPGRVARVSDVQHALSPELDRNIIAPPGEERKLRVSTSFPQHGIRSHVLLAACEPKEFAWESGGRGAFTTALLQALIATGADKVTYAGIIQKLHSLPKQNPRCEGLNQDRIIFNAKVRGADPGFLNIEQQGGTYTLGAGIAQGIAVGSEFVVYRDPQSASEPSLCTLRVKATEASRATLEPLDSVLPCTLPRPAHARQVRCGPDNELRVHFTKALKDVVDVEAVQPDGANTGFIFTKMDQAALLADVDNRAGSIKVVLSTTNPGATTYGIVQLPHTVPPKAEALSRVLRSAARWNWHLNCTNTKAHLLSKMVDLEFYRLRQVDSQYDRQGMPVLTPVGDNLNRTGVVQLVVDPNHLFGFKIVNRTVRPLYPYLFYFDIGDQSVGSYYLASSGKIPVDPPLRPRSSMTIGYGTAGELPLAFVMGGSEKVEIGFLKLFLTTTQTDFGSLAQDSPFSSTRAQLPRNDVRKKLHTMGLWGMVMVTIVQLAEPL